MSQGTIQNFTNLTTAKHLNKWHLKSPIFGRICLCHSANHGSLHPRGDRKVGMHYIYQLSAILTVRPFFFFWKKCFYLSICFPCLCVGVCKERKISSETWPEIKGAVSVKHYNFSEALMIWGLQTRLQPEVAILSFPS